MSANRYTVFATMKAVRDIFEQRPDRPLEARWKDAKGSEMFRGFQLRCSTSARVLLAAAIPLLLVGLIVSRSTVADDHTILKIVLAISYAALSMAISWQLGINAAAKGMAKHAAHEKHPV